MIVSFLLPYICLQEPKPVLWFQYTALLDDPTSMQSPHTLTFTFAIKARNHSLYTMATFLEYWGDCDRCRKPLIKFHMYWDSNKGTQVQLVLQSAIAPL